MSKTPDSSQPQGSTKKGPRVNGGPSDQRNKTLTGRPILSPAATARDVAAAKRTLKATSVKAHDRTCACRKPWTRGGLGHCPAHDRRADQEPSLQVSVPAAGEVWLCCIQGCRSGVLREGYLDLLVYADSR